MRVDDLHVDRDDPRTRAAKTKRDRTRGALLASAEKLFAERGFAIELQGVDRLIGACAIDDGRTVREIREGEPQLVRELLAQGPTLLAEFDKSATAGREAITLVPGQPAAGAVAEAARPVRRG